MADPKESQQLVPSAVPRTNAAPLRKQRLAVMPLAVLLPSLGSTQDIQPFRSMIIKHLEDLHAGAAAISTEEDNEARRKRLAEESMLNQVLQWLSVGSED